MTEIPSASFEEENEKLAFLKRVKEQEDTLLTMPTIEKAVNEKLKKSLQSPVELPEINGVMNDLINDRFSETIAAAQSAREWVYHQRPPDAPDELAEKLAVAKENKFEIESLRMQALNEIRARAQNKYYNGQSSQMQLKAESEIANYISAGEAAYHANMKRFDKR